MISARTSTHEDFASAAMNEMTALGGIKSAQWSSRLSFSYSSTITMTAMHMKLKSDARSSNIQKRENRVLRNVRSSVILLTSGSVVPLFVGCRCRERLLRAMPLLMFFVWLPLIPPPRLICSYLEDIKATRRSVAIVGRREVS